MYHCLLTVHRIEEATTEGAGAPVDDLGRIEQAHYFLWFTCYYGLSLITWRIETGEVPWFLLISAILISYPMYRGVCQVRRAVGAHKTRLTRSLVGRTTHRNFIDEFIDERWGRGGVYELQS